MTDLHALLRESIIREDIRDPDDRARIYAEARRAVMRRLWDQDPPIRMEEIDERIATFDSAAAVIERDIRDHFEADELNGHAAAPAVSHADAPSAMAPTPPEPSPPAPSIHADDPTEATHAPLHQDLAWEAERDDEVEDPPPEPDWDIPDEEAYPATFGGDEGTDPADDDDGYNGYPAARYDEDDDEGYYAPPAMRPPRSADVRSGSRSGGRSDTGAYAAPLGYDSTDDLDEAAYRAPAQADRWSEPVGQSVAAPRTVEVKPSRQRRKVNRSSLQAGLLVTAIIIMLGGLAGFAWLFLNPLDTAAPERSVTVAIEDRRQVSDAATAIRVASEAIAIQQTFSVFDGQDPTVFEAASDNPVRFDNDASGGFARIASSAGSAGARVVIGPGLAERLAGRDIRVRIVVRESTDRGAGSMRFAYQSGVAISHWQTATLEPGYTEVGIRWRVPGIRTNLGGDYLVIEPGIPGDGTGVDIRAVEIDLLAPGAS